MTNRFRLPALWILFFAASSLSALGCGSESAPGMGSSPLPQPATQPGLGPGGASGDAPSPVTANGGATLTGQDPTAGQPTGEPPEAPSPTAGAGGGSGGASEPQQPLRELSFLRAEGRVIVNDDGPFTLRTLGIGNWMVLEAYMLRSRHESPEDFENDIRDLVGEERRKQFYAAWYQNFFNEADMQFLAEQGFNGVRIPLMFPDLLNAAGEADENEVGYQLMDDVVRWAKQWGMYVIPDLHVPPGGANANWPHRYGPGPALWESETYIQQTIDIWRLFAQKYADEPAIGGYDLINEPDSSRWGLGQDIGENNSGLRELYARITSAIREFDTNHIVFAEGNGFARRFNGLGPPWDDNMAYAFHFYAETCRPEGAAGSRDLREQYDVPLWLGETGENSNDWFKNCVTAFEADDVGWAWWPYKKVDNVAGPLNVRITPEYRRLLDYWQGKAGKPSADEAFAGLMSLAESVKLENTHVQRGVIDALIRQPHSEETLPFAERRLAPGEQLRIQAEDYDLGRVGAAYADQDTEWTGGWPPRFGYWNQGNIYRNDGVDIGYRSSEQSHYVGWIEAGEWLVFSLQNDAADSYTLSAQISGSGRISVHVNGEQELSSSFSGSGWHSAELGQLALPAGENKLRVVFESGGFDVDYFELK